MPEVEKREVEKSEPAAPARKRSPFELIAFAWLFLLAAAVAGSVHYVLPTGGFFGRPMSSSAPIRPSHVVGVVAGLLVLFAAKRLLEGRMDWPKPREGRWVRIVAYLSTVGLGIFAAVQLHQVPEIESRWYPAITTLTLIGKPFSLRPIFFPSATLMLLVGVIAHFLYSKPRWADFLIETEGELRKVSWPQRKEWVGSSIVVILVVTITALFLWACDEVLTWLMVKTNLGF